MHTAVEEVSTATVTVDKADAGKTLSVDLYTIVSTGVRPQCGQLFVNLRTE